MFYKKSAVLLLFSIAALQSMIFPELACGAPAASLADIRLPIVTDAMMQYSHIRYSIFFGTIAYSLTVFLLLMQTGVSSKLRDYAIRINRNKAAQIVVYSMVLTLLISLCTFPLAYFSGFYIEHQFGMSDQSLTAFLMDRLKGTGVSAVIDLIALLVFFGIVSKFRKHWPIILWLLSIPLSGIAIFAEPIAIDPIFNKFTPMQESVLKTKIQYLATKAGISDATILVSDRSKQTNKMNAYVTGIGNSSRIVLWDSTINKLPEDQVLAVVGHETGHYVLKHIYWGFLFTELSLLLFVPFAYLFANSFVSALPKRWGVGSINDYAITPVLMALLLTVGFASMPFINFFSRYIEHQADQYGLDLTGDRLAMANLFITFSEKNLSEPDPSPIIKFFLFTHPTLKERIEFAAGRKIE